MFITISQLKATGADIDRLDTIMLSSLSIMTRSLFEKYKVEVVLLVNGLNSGSHTSELHSQGKAVDFYVTGDLRPWDIVVEMILAGFNGIGVYWNDKAYSYHGDIREKNGQWFCKIKGKKRAYSGLINTA